MSCKMNFECDHPGRCCEVCPRTSCDDRCENNRTTCGLWGKEHKPWTEEEKQYVIANVGKMSCGQMGIYLGRTGSKVNSYVGWLKKKGVLANDCK